MVKTGDGGDKEVFYFLPASGVQDSGMVSGHLQVRG